ncbi:MAG TPA: penicillin-binding transpeptidase domain-containing protein [Acidimicrobiales bacterium]|nr:penicillin-binding transpeptidase domain-containing protein [Acidimicrobiales bacterium]
MNRQIRRLGLAIMLLYTVLFVQLNRIQVFGAQRLNDDVNNTRDILRDFGKPRGAIITSDGMLLAQSLPTDEGKRTYRREYPQSWKFAHITGHFSSVLGSAGVEQTYNDQLSGQTLKQRYRSFTDLFVDRDTTANVVLSVNSKVQLAAVEALGDQRGSVVAIDPRTGEILAMYSNPAYDPTFLADLSTQNAEAVSILLNADPQKPLLARSYREIFFPGSTFKVVTAAAGLDAGVVTPEAPVYPAATGYTPPNVRDEFAISNFNRQTCGGSLFQILRDSCNSAFARMGTEDVGPDRMIRTAEAFGFNSKPPIDLPAPAASTFPTSFGARLQTLRSYYASRGIEIPESPDPVYVTESSGPLAQSSIGQNDVAATPLQMAMVAAAVANDGVMMKPHVMKEIRDLDGNLVSRYEPAAWRRAMTSQTASTLRDAMRGVVDAGTATAMFVDGLETGGKTGTAQLGTPEPSSHAWIIGFSGLPGQPSSIAVAAIIEAQPGASEQTGGRVAAPIVRSVIEAALR